jgi:hypothetical protein
MNSTMNRMKDKTPAMLAVESQISWRLRDMEATLNMMPSTPRMLKLWRERVLKCTLEVEVGRLQAGQGFKELFGSLLGSRERLRSAAEFVLTCRTDLIPVDGGDPVLRLSGLGLDASDDRIRNFPGEVGVPFLGKQHDLSDGEPMGLHSAFLPCRVRAGRNARTRKSLCGRCEALVYLYA